MPIFEYECPNGHGRFEKIVQKADNQDPQPCPHCGAASLKKPATPSPMQWGKSGGWN